MQVYISNGNGIDKVALMTLPESYSLLVLMYAAPVLVLKTTRNQKHRLEGNAIQAGCKAKC